MDLLMHVLLKSEKLGIDNSKLTMIDLIGKLEEETAEIRDAKENKNDIEIGRETLDVIQICIAILNKLHENGIDIQKINMDHERKLITEREWLTKKDIKIRVMQ